MLNEGLEPAALLDSGSDEMLQSEGRSAVVARDQTEQPHVRQTTPNLRQNIGLVPLDAVNSAEKADLPLAIEDYALIGDCTTAALVGRNGSIDWLCWPRFDSDACFAALLGTSEHGRWRICPVDPAARVSRTYRDSTMILETVFETADGCVALIDFMPTGQANSSVIRLVEGRRGAAPTTSLPEQLRGQRNWDYRYCWLRDATFTLLALMSAGYLEEAKAWREWLQRSVAGSPDQIQLVYGLSGERQLFERQASWLPGY
jgi:GH15 family glucan-1,4-alpha-glucosidase